MSKGRALIKSGFFAMRLSLVVAERHGHIAFVASYTEIAGDP